MNSKEKTLGDGARERILLGRGRLSLTPRFSGVAGRLEDALNRFSGFPGLTDCVGHGENR
jgi:hypothetical protein